MAERGRLAVIALGGMAGAVARHAVSTGLPMGDGGVPWSTLIVNGTGCLLIGVLMTLIGAARRPHPLAQHFLAVGVLGGYTTFSTYAVDARVLIAAGRPVVALGYLAGTLVIALVAVWLGVIATRAVLR